MRTEGCAQRVVVVVACSEMVCQTSRGQPSGCSVDGAKAKAKASKSAAGGTVHACQGRRRTRHGPHTDGARTTAQQQHGDPHPPGPHRSGRRWDARGYIYRARRIGHRHATCMHGPPRAPALRSAPSATVRCKLCFATAHHPDGLIQPTSCRAVRALARCSCRG